MTIEPRRRKFHKAITVTMPLPERVAHYNGRPSTFAGGGGGGGSGPGGDDSSGGASRKTSFDSGQKLYLGEDRDGNKSSLDKRRRRRRRVIH